MRTFRQVSTTTVLPRIVCAIPFALIFVSVAAAAVGFLFIIHLCVVCFGDVFILLKVAVISLL